MSIFWGILIAILTFGVMIFLHEFGHYFAARLCHVKVLEFAVGMGPRLFSHTSQKTGIQYSLCALPIGGYTAMQGEDGEDPDPGALVNRPRWQRLIVLLAGSFMNIVSGMIAMFIYLSITGMVGSCVVADFRENAVSNAWLQEGDQIVAIDGRKMVDYTDVANTIMIDGIEAIDIEVIRNGETLLLEEVSFSTEEQEGVLVGVLDFRFLGVKPSLSVLIKQTFTQSFATVKMIYKTFIQLFTGRFGINGVTGPVGTVSVIAEAASMGFLPILYLFVFISLNLGVMNLLPFPALDGGRILFILVEMVRRKPLNPKFEGYVHMAGMAVLLAFMAVVAVLDVMKLA